MIELKRHVKFTHTRILNEDISLTIKILRVGMVKTNMYVKPVNRGRASRVGQLDKVDSIDDLLWKILTMM